MIEWPLNVANFNKKIRLYNRSIKGICITLTTESFDLLLCIIGRHCYCLTFILATLIL
jgi:hypothetical protein